MLPPPNPLSPEHRRQLLAFARQTIAAAVRHAASPEPPAEIAGFAGCGAFVSLHLNARLRGCVGMLESNLSLPATIAHCALRAAMEDPRFRPLEPAELEKAAIEISLLSPFTAAAAGEVEPGRHGVLIRKDPYAGLLLPQVAQKYHWSQERFLQETCQKAGLPPEAWRDPATKIFIFTAEVFSE